MSIIAMGDQAAANPWYSYAKACMAATLRNYLRNNAFIEQWYYPTDDVKIQVRMINRQPQAMIYVEDLIGITLRNLTKSDPLSKRLFFKNQNKISAGVVKKTDYVGYNYWVNREKTRCISNRLYEVGFNSHNYTSDFFGVTPRQLESVCLVSPSDKAQLKILYPDYEEYGYGVLASPYKVGGIALLLLKKEVGTYILNYVVEPLPNEWKHSCLSAMSQWHDSGTYLLKSFYSYDAAGNPYLNSKISSVIGTLTPQAGNPAGVKVANGVVIKKLTPSISSGQLQVASETAFSYTLYDQILMAGGYGPNETAVGTSVSSGTPQAGYKDFPACTNVTYILPLGVEQDAISFYVTEATEIDFYASNVLTVIDPGGLNIQQFDTVNRQTYVYNASVVVLDINTGGVIEKIALEQGVRKHMEAVSMIYEPVLQNEVFDATYNYYVPLYLNSLFKVFVYLKSSSVDHQVYGGPSPIITNVKTHNLYIKYNDVEHLVATGIIKDTNFNFTGVAAMPSGNRMELIPDITMAMGERIGGVNTFCNNGMGYYGADFKNELIISINRNLYTEEIPNNSAASVVDLHAGHTWLFQKSLVDPVGTSGYSYGNGKFITKLVDESSTYYADVFSCNASGQIIMPNNSPTVAILST